MPWPPAMDPFTQLSDDARHHEAVRSRTDTRDRLARASEVATWQGLLRDLAERRMLLVVRMAGGRTYRGQLVGLAADHVVVAAEDTRRCHLRTTGIRSLRADPTGPRLPATGDRDLVGPGRLLEVLEHLSEHQSRVLLGLETVAEALQGRLIGLGIDVLTLQPDGGSAGSVYVPLDAVQEVVGDR